MSGWTLMEGDSLELMLDFPEKIDLLVTDPPYAFGGSGGEHELSATVAVVLREAAQRMERGSWAVVFAASSWRSTSYMVDAVRGVLDPVRIGTWVKPESRTKVATSGWRWASVKSAAQGRDGTIHNEHVFSLFGPWCYICGVRKRWWKFWQRWTEDDHDEPF